MSAEIIQFLPPPNQSRDQTDFPRLHFVQRHSLTI
jgi:hypothetical protein